MRSINTSSYLILFNQLNAPVFNYLNKLNLIKMQLTPKSTIELEFFFICVDYIKFIAVVYIALPCSANLFLFYDFTRVKPSDTADERLCTYNL